MDSLAVLIRAISTSLLISQSRCEYYQPIPAGANPDPGVKLTGPFIHTEQYHTEAYGYHAGDRMLAEVAGRLRSAVGDEGMLGRMAGDEFVCLLKDRTRADAEALAEQAYRRVTSFRLEVRPDHHAAVGLGFGAAESLTDGQSIDELLHAAADATLKGDGTAAQPLGLAVPLIFVGDVSDGNGVITVTNIAAGGPAVFAVGGNSSPSDRR